MAVEDPEVTERLTTLEGRPPVIDTEDDTDAEDDAVDGTGAPPPPPTFRGGGTGDMFRGECCATGGRLAIRGVVGAGVILPATLPATLPP
jgi:hypothetical protein